MSLFSKNLKFLRKKGDYKQDDIAGLFNKQANTIGNWENQKSEPSLGELVRLGAFFKVSTEDFLHKDLEKDSFQQSPGLPDAGTRGNRVISYPLQELPASLAHEAGADAFWVILRELRALNDKVDILMAVMESSPVSRHSDKSYH
jgi:transcriptional regulator with XRE-family HTH domain